jgi:hypothetical protein
MGTEESAEEVDDEMARALGLFALSNASVHEAAAHTDVTGWELEQAIERAGLAEPFGIDTETDVSKEIDSLLDSQLE